MNRANLLHETAGRLHVVASDIEEPLVTIKSGGAWSGPAADRLELSLQMWSVTCSTVAERLRQHARAMVAEAWLLEQ